MSPIVSVVVCTHKPREDFLARVVTALRRQTLQFSNWELLLIDNASPVPVGNVTDISWHPQARHILEVELGLTHARLRGIKEAAGSLIVFVDDDNVLSSDYLERAAEAAEKYPFLGVWSGSIQPEFESEPPDWTERYWPWLALRDVTSLEWSKDVHEIDAQPCGAGMCVRAEVAQLYAHDLAQHSDRRNLDRRGGKLMSCGDTDIAFTSTRLGLGWGLVPELRLTHLIPSFRLTETYLLELAEGLSHSWGRMMTARGFSARRPPPKWVRVLRFLSQTLSEGRRHARISWARDQGVALAFEHAAAASLRRSRATHK